MYDLISSFSLCKSSCFKETNFPCLHPIFISEINKKMQDTLGMKFFLIRSWLCPSLNHNCILSLINKSFRWLPSLHLRLESHTSFGLINLLGYFFNVCQMYLYIKWHFKSLKDPLEWCFKMAEFYFTVKEKKDATSSDYVFTLQVFMCLPLYPCRPWASLARVSLLNYLFCLFVF